MTELKICKAKTNVSFRSVFPLNLSTPSSQIAMQIKMINAWKRLRLPSSDFISFITFLEVLVMGKSYQWGTYFGCFANQSSEKRLKLERMKAVPVLLRRHTERDYLLETGVLKERGSWRRCIIYWLSRERQWEKKNTTTKQNAFLIVTGFPGDTGLTFMLEVVCHRVPTLPWSNPTCSVPDSSLK